MKKPAFWLGEISTGARAKVHGSLSFIVIAAGLCAMQISCQAWDYEGHRLVNQLALVSLPAEFPAFALTPEARERIAFLAGEPDRWRNASDPTLAHANGPDHFIDLEELELYGLSVTNLTHFRSEFAGQLALARAAHPEKFPPIDPAFNKDHTRELIGFLPWAIVENFDKLKSEFSYLKAFEQDGGTPDEIANARADIIYTMGVMGHYVGDAAQPLHATEHFNGWGNYPNPDHFTTNRIHSKVDGFFRSLPAADFAEMQGRIHPAKSPVEELGGRPGDFFAQIMNYITDQGKLVVPLYELEKSGRLFADGEKGAEGRAFLSGQLLKGGQMLGDLWFFAWQTAPKDTYLSQQLARRKAEQSGATAK